MESPTEIRKPMKGWIRVVLIIIPFLIVVGLFQVIGYSILGLHLSDLHVQKTPFQETVGALFTLFGTIAVIGIFRRFIDQESFQSLGFYPTGFCEETLIGLGLGALIMSAGFASLAFLNAINWMGTNLDAGQILLGLFMYIMVAISEELFLRGYILNNLMQSMHRMMALLVSAVLFSLMHLFNAHYTWYSFLNILLAGILLGLPYIYTKRLWLPIALHFSWNFFQGTIFGFNVSGHESYSLIVQSRTVDNLWNGGDFGFEGSALAAVFQVIAIFFLWEYYSKKAQKPVIAE